MYKRKGKGKMENGYSICFNEWALDKDIKNELGLLLIISSLCAEKGYCYANNSYLANLFDIDEVSVSRKLKKLEKKGYITIDYKMSGNVITSREIRLTKMLTAVNKNVNGAVNKNVKDNNINNINNINYNNIKENTKRKVFEKPTIEEIKQYCEERQNGINPIAFYNFYESKDWYIGKNKMKDFKACIRTWELRNKKENKEPNWMSEEVDSNLVSDDDEIMMKNLLKEFN